MCSIHGMVCIPLRNNDGEELDWGEIFKDTDYYTPIPVKAPIKPRPIQYTDALYEKKPFQKMNDFKFSEYRTHEFINTLYTESELMNLPFDDLHCFEYKGYVIPIFPPNSMGNVSVDYWKEFAKDAIDLRNEVKWQTWSYKLGVISKHKKGGN